MNRITERMLESKVAYINKLKGIENPGVCVPGSYYLDFAYGGVSLARVINEGGGINSVFGCGFVPKRELFGLLNAYIEGLTTD